MSRDSYPSKGNFFLYFYFFLKQELAVLPLRVMSKRFEADKL
jgi:hypothetical protein